MKKITIIVIALLGAFMTTFAQDTNLVQAEKEYNSWSIDLGAGVNKPLEPFADGYYTNTPDFLSADLGIRYMINEKFGLNLGLGFDKFAVL